MLRVKSTGGGEAQAGVPDRAGSQRQLMTLSRRQQIPKADIIVSPKPDVALMDRIAAYALWNLHRFS